MTTGSQRSNWIAIALFASLAANLFLAGWLIGRQSSFRFSPPPPPPFDRVFNDQIRQTLSPDGAKRMEAAFNAIRDHFANRSDDSRALRERQNANLRADHFDADDYIAASKAMRLSHDKDRDAADEELARAIAQLSVDDRRKLGDIRHGHFGGPPDGPPPRRDHF